MMIVKIATADDMIEMSRMPKVPYDRNAYAGQDVLDTYNLVMGKSLFYDLRDGGSKTKWRFDPANNPFYFNDNPNPLDVINLNTLGIIHF